MENEDKFGLYMKFAIAFLLCLLILNKLFRFTESTTLIVILIFAIPLLYIYIPDFKIFINNITKFKIGNFEVTLKEEVENILTKSFNKNDLLSIDIGQRVLDNKGSLQTFSSQIKNYIKKNDKNIVLILDVKENNNLYIPMIYFQSKIIEKLFGLRALLIQKSDEGLILDKIIGTIKPEAVYKIIEKDYENIETAFYSSFNWVKFYKNNKIQNYLDTSWNNFYESLNFNNINNEDSGISLMKFHNLFSNDIGKNIITYPVDKSEYHKLLRIFDSESNYVVLTRNKNIESVRTINNISRELLVPILRKLLDILNIKKA